MNVNKRTKLLLGLAKEKIRDDNIISSPLLQEENSIVVNLNSDENDKNILRSGKFAKFFLPSYVYFFLNILILILIHRV